MIKPCKKCHQNPPLLNGICEECQITRIKHTRYRERRLCRETVNRLLTENPNLTLTKIAFWTEYDTVPIIPSDGVRNQARKMLLEEKRK